MSIWDRIRGAKRAADQHQNRTSEQQQHTPLTVQPYHHVPTHARQDAMHAMPGAAVEDTRRRIKEQHQRRSALGLNSGSNRSSSANHPPLLHKTSSVNVTSASIATGPSSVYSVPSQSHPPTLSSATTSMGGAYMGGPLSAAAASGLGSPLKTRSYDQTEYKVDTGLSRPSLSRELSYKAIGVRRASLDGPRANSTCYPIAFASPETLISSRPRTHFLRGQ